MMAPRKPKLVTVNEPRDFDFDSFILGFKRPEFTRNLYRKADLIPKLAELEELTGDLEVRLAKLEAAEGDNADRGVTDINPAVQLRERLTVLTEEFNELAQEYQDSAEAFTFRIPDKKQDQRDVDAAMKADGVYLDKQPETTDEQVEYADLCAVYSMSLTCTSHPMTVAQWQMFRELVGEPAFMTLATAWLEAVKASRPGAPFSPKPLPGPAKAASSNA